MSIINSLEIKNFKCLKNFHIENLKPITLLSGKNNAGKTTLLDAIYFANKVNKPDMLIKLHNTRGIQLNKLTPENLWGDFFYDRNLELPCHIDEYFLGKKYSLLVQTKKTNDSSNLQLKTTENIISSVNYPSLIADVAFEEVKGRVTTSITGESSINQNVSGNLKAFSFPNVIYLDTHKSYNPSIIEYFGKIDIEGKTGQIVEVLKIIEPAIKELSVVVIGGMSQIFALTDNSSRKTPLKSMGDGLNRLLEMIITVIANPNSIILIDEIENGFHYSIHKDLWKVLGKAALSANSQLIATTHSYECISSSVEAAKECDFAEKFEYIRIDKENDDFIMNYYNDKLLDNAVQNEVEVR